MKKFCMMLVMALMVCMISPVTSTEVKAASTATKAKNAYKKMMTSGKTITWGQYKRKLSVKNCEYKYIYLNNDSVPELVVTSNEAAHAEGYYQIYRYSKGKVKYVGNVGDTLAFYKKKGIIAKCYGNMGTWERKYYKYSSGKLTSVKLKTYSEYDFNKQAMKNKYYYNGKKVAKATFTSKLKKYVGKTKMTEDDYTNWKQGK